MNTRSHRRFRTLSAGILTAILLAAIPLFWMVGSAQRGGAAPGLAQDTTPDALRFQYMGPPSSGRISAVVGIPGDTTTYYAGAASGGIWKTTDGGKTFVPIFDDQPVQAIGALGLSPRPTRRSYGRAPARRGRSATPTCRETASTSPPTRAPPGRTWA